MLAYENNANPFEMRKSTISEFINEYETVFVSANSAETVESKAKEIMSTVLLTVGFVRNQSEVFVR